MKLNKKQEKEIYDFIYNYPTNQKSGFLPDEIDFVLRKYKDLYPHFDMDKWDDSMMGNTCGMYKGKFVIYHCDILHGLYCGIEGRGMTIDEWD